MALIATTTALAVGTPAATAHAVGSRPPKADYSFFKGKTINLLVTNVPGGPQGVAAVSLQPYLEKYLGAKVNVTYDTALEQDGEQRVMGEPSNGLYLGIANITTDIIDQYFKVPLGFKLNSMSLVAAVHSPANLAVACGTAPWATAQDLFNGSQRAVGIGVFPSSQYLGQLLLFSSYKLPYKILTGYTGATANPACQRGDGNFTIGSVAQLVDSAGTAVLPGVTPLLRSGKIPTGSPEAFLNAKVPSLESYAAAHPPTTKTGKEAVKLALQFFNVNVPSSIFFGPQGIPADRLQALIQVFEKAGRQAGAKASFLKGGLPTGIYAPSKIHPYLNSTLGETATVRQLAHVKAS